MTAPGVWPAQQQRWLAAVAIKVGTGLEKSVRWIGQVVSSMISEDAQAAPMDKSIRMAG